MCKLIKEVSRIKKQKRDYKIKMDNIIATQKELENKLQIIRNYKKRIKRIGEIDYSD